MINEFVSYEIALKLKELGFDESCFAFVNEDRKLIFFDSQTAFYRTNSEVHHCRKIWNIFTNKNKLNLAAIPVWQQAFDWLFKKLDFWYPYLSVTIYSDGSGDWRHPKEDDIEAFEIEFDNKEQMILEAIKLLENETRTNTN
jgi:hypothetical protein